MQADRVFGEGEAVTSTRIAAIALVDGGLMACPTGMPVAFGLGFGFAPMSFAAIYRMAYEQALSRVSARPSLYDRVRNPCWN